MKSLGQTLQGLAERFVFSERRLTKQTEVAGFVRIRGANRECLRILTNPATQNTRPCDAVAHRTSSAVTHQVVVLRRVPSDAKMFERFFSRHDVADIERAELGIVRGGFVKTHRVDDFLDVFRSTAPQGYAPFPVIKAS